MVCGDALRSNDPRYTILTRNMDIIFAVASTPNNVCNVFPWLQYVPPFSRDQADQEARMKESLDIMRGIVAEHRATFDADHVRDMVDAFLREQMIQDRTEGVNNHNFTDEQISYIGVESYFG